MSEPLPYGELVNEPPPGFVPTMQLAWIESDEERDHFGEFKAVLFQRWKAREGNEDYVWVPIPYYR